MLSVIGWFRNRPTAGCDTQIGNEPTRSGCVSPKIARRRGVSPKYLSDGHSVMSIEWVHGWVSRRAVLRFAAQMERCDTQNPTSIVVGGGRRRLDFAGPQAAGEVYQQAERDWTSSRREQDNYE